MADSFFSSHTVKLCVSDTGDVLLPFFAVTVHLYVPARLGLKVIVVVVPATLVSVVFESGPVTFT